MQRAVIVALFGLCASSASAETRQYAVVVANSSSLNEKVAALEYADDDAARYAELFDGIATRVELLTVLDSEIQRIYPRLARRAKKPDRASVLGTLNGLFAEMSQDVEQGHSVIFYFILIGHGEVGPDGEGHVALLDGPLTRSDLYDEVIRRSPATFNHIIVDACNSYFIINRRGDSSDQGPSRADSVRTYLRARELSAYPNTGVLVSTSGAKESHEWSGYRAGVFSHELRSALSGAADANGDGLIEYSEVHAFVAAANSTIDDPRARVEMFVVPPQLDVKQPLIDLQTARFDHWLSVPKGRPTRFFLEDDRGVRYADVHSDGATDTFVALVPRAHYFVRSVDRRTELKLELREPGSLTLDVGGMQRATIAARGAIDDAFQHHLFESPYGRSFHEGHAAANNYPPLQPVAQAWRPHRGSFTTVRASPHEGRSAVPAWLAFGGSVALATGGLLAHLQSAGAVAEYEQHLQQDRVVGISRQAAQDLQSKAESWAWGRNVLLTSSGVAAVVGLAYLMWPSDDDPGPNLAVVPLDRGGLLGFGGQF